MKAHISKTKEANVMNKRTEKQSAKITDEKIIELYWQRNEDAIKVTDAKYGKMLLRIAYNILHDRLDCEECQNDTYIKIWNRIPPTKPHIFPSFISKFMRDIAIDRYKKKRSKKQIPSELTISLEESCDSLSDGALIDEETAAAELSRLVNDYIRTLSKRQHYIFIGRFYFCETLEQIAADLGISASTVSREAEKLKTGLKEHLERNGVSS